MTPRSSRSARVRADRGAATAETAVVLPVVVLMVLVIAVAGLGISHQLRLEGAARSAARELARGEDEDAAISAARRTAGEGTVVTIGRDGEWVTVTATRRLHAPRGPLAGAAWTLRADATARLEPQLVGRGP